MAYQIIWEKAAGNLRGALPTVTQGGTYEVITILALYRDGSAVSLTGKPLTATATDKAGNTTEITGTLTGGAGSFTWEFSGGDIGTPGVYTVIVTYNLGDGGLWASDPAPFTVLPNPAADAVQNPALVGIGAEDAAWVAAGSAGGALGDAAYEDATAFDAAGSAAAVQDNLDDLIDLLTPAEAVLSAVAEYITIELSWTYTPAGEYTGFKLYRKIGSGGSFALLDTLAKTETDYTDSALTPSVEYFYRLDAYNGFFTSASNVASATTEALDFDFTAMSDGALPAVFTAPTFAIATGKVTNTPLLGAELLTDPGLEANYTAGKCDTLTKGGSPTLAQSADVHGGSKAQQFTGVAFNNALNYPTVNGIAGAWYKFSAWGKRTAGTNTEARIDIYQASSLPQVAYSQAITAAAYQQESVAMISTGTTAIFPYPASEKGSSAYCTVIVDDGSLKRITYADLFALVDSGNRAAIAKVQPSPMVDGTLSGVVAWANAAASPDTYLIAYWRYRQQKDRISFGLMKCVAGTYSVVIAETSAITVTDAYLEIRPVTDTSVALYYNNVQVSTTQTVNDVPGSYAGFLVSGGNSLKRFFVG